MDVGSPISYEVLEKGTPVYSSDGHKIGKVAHVLVAEDEDVFDGIVVSEHFGLGDHRFVDADEVERIGERGVILRLTRSRCAGLPAPSANPAVMKDDPAEPSRVGLADKLRRAWDYVSGNY